MTKKSNRESSKEFRKIKSLDFLYEVNEDGTVVRTVKSKRRLKIRLDYHHSKVGYYRVWIKRKGIMVHRLVAECWLGDKPEGYEIDHINRDVHNNHYTNLRYVTHGEQMKNRVLSDRIIEQAKKNCLEHCLKYITKPVTIIKNERKLEFRSMTKAAEYIAKEKGLKTEHIRSKFKQRRKKIYEYDILYRDAETGK